MFFFNDFKFDLFDRAVARLRLFRLLRFVEWPLLAACSKDNFVSVRKLLFQCIDLKLELELIVGLEVFDLGLKPCDTLFLLLQFKDKGLRQTA